MHLGHRCCALRGRFGLASSPHRRSVVSESVISEVAGCVEQVKWRMPMTFREEMLRSNSFQLPRRLLTRRAPEERNGTDKHALGLPLRSAHAHRLDKLFDRHSEILPQSYELVKERNWGPGFHRPPGEWGCREALTSAPSRCHCRRAALKSCEPRVTHQHRLPCSSI